ncbi:uncharacterized protein LOC135152758 [Daucus carota subsp. sativus]|uniref:uncharacterized protein LOC135152758 n=1 Tax=Daucus carota subsp. sativus TaxID=79200 RepID=UPI0030827B8A
MASVKYLCDVFGERIRKNPQWMCKELAETIKKEMEIEVPRIKILRLRKMALEGVAKSLKEHYSRVRDFGQEVLLSNPQNTVKISTTRLNEDDPLLSAVGRDENNQMFPICYAVVESENTDSWRWFNTGVLKKCFWNIALSTHKVAYTEAMKEMEKHSKSAHAQLSAIDPKQWCKAFFATHSKVDNTDNNMSERFNSWIINERYMPLLTMLQEIQFKLMTRMRQKRDDMLASDLQICPKIKKYLDVLITESRKWNAAWDGERKFQVKQGTRCVTVDLERGNCDCRVYDLTGMPCQHAIAAIHSRRHNPTDYVSDYYKREKYLAAYKHSLEAMKGEEYWDFHGGEIMLPPDIPKRLRGMPKKLRRREAWEGGSRSQTAPSQGVLLQRFSNKKVMHCSNCGDASHRLAKCPTMGKDSATTPTEATKKNETPTGAKRKATKEVRRQKLKPRKAQPGIVIREPEEGGKPQTQASQTGPVKDKGKAVEEEVPQSVWDILEEQGEDPTEEQGGEERLSFFTKIPKKKMPLMRGQETDEWEKSGKNYADFQE